MLLEYTGKAKPKGILWDIYFCFILAMPYDVFYSTAIIKLEQPDYIEYYRVSVFYLSILFIPIILYSLFNLNKKEEEITIKPFLLIVLLIAKDVFRFLFGIDDVPDSYYFSTYGNYIVASSYFLCVAHIYKGNMDHFLIIYAVVNVATLFCSVFTGIGQEVLIGRSHMSALQHGETATVLSILSLYFAFKKSGTFNILIIIGGIALVLTTGNRKDICFILIPLLIYLFRKRKNDYQTNNNSNKFFYFFVGVIIMLIILALFENTLLSLINTERYREMIVSINNSGLTDFVKEDDSFLGRVDSIQAGFKVISSHPVLGSMFSLVDCQKEIQSFDYPTFPHSTVIYLFCVMGVFALIPIIFFYKTGFLLIRKNLPLQYVFIYILIRDTISGGANESIKYLLLMMIMLNYGRLAIINFDNKKSKNNNSAAKSMDLI